MKKGTNSETKKDNHIGSELKDVIRVISLFSGAGMLDKSFLDDPKFEIVYAAEYDHYAAETYRRNIGNHIEEVDIRTLVGAELPQADVIIGGPPCQPISNSNRHESARGFLHHEGDMFAHYIRLVRECRAKVFLIENVPALISEKFKYYMDLIKTSLPEFKVTAKTVCDCDLGGFTKRKRAIVIGTRISEEKPVFPDIKFRPVRTVKDALMKVDRSWPNAKDITESNDLVKEKISLVPEGGNWKDLPEKYWTKSVHSNMYRRLDRNLPAVSIANWRKYLLSPPKWTDSPEWDRILSVSEAAALQGCNKDFVFTGSLASMQQQVANGVTRAIGTYAKNIIKQIFGKEN